LGIDGPVNTSFTGSGDRTIDYINLLVFNLLALFSSTVWSILDRNRKHYENLVYWIRLLAFDRKRILNVLVLNKPAPAVDLKPLFIENRHRYGVLILKVLFIISIIIPNTVNTWGWYQQLENREENVPLYGIWEVEEFIRNGETIPPLFTDEERWQYLILEHPGRAVHILWIRNGISSMAGLMPRAKRSH
jgi:hypothetical protein